MMESGLSTMLKAEGLEEELGNDCFRLLLDSLFDGVYFVDRERRILFWNQGAERLSGYSSDEVVGQCCRNLLLNHVDEQGRHLCKSRCPLVQTIQSGQPRSKRVYLRHKDGTRIPVDTHIMPVRNHQGKIIGGVEIFRDARPMIELEVSNSRLRDLSEHDPLTGLANRRHIEQVIYLQQSRLDREGSPFCVVLFDLDRFKAINDRFGHTVGDEALVKVAQALSQSVRQADVAGRLGGDEFLLVLPGHRMGSARSVGVRVQRRIGRCSVGDPPVRLGTSFGVAEGRPNEPAEELIAEADRELYRAKASRGEGMEAHREPSRVEAKGR